MSQLRDTQVPYSSPSNPSTARRHQESNERKHWLLALAAVTTTAVLVACGGNGPTPQPPSPHLAEVNISVHGGPLGSDGLVEKHPVVVTVSDSDNNTVRFDDSNVHSPTGGKSELVIGETDASVTIYLPEGNTYTFAAVMPDGLGNALAAGTGQRVITGASSNASALRLTTVMSTAHLATRLPTSFVQPGQELDLVFATSPVRADLMTPYSDYVANYSVTNGTALGHSSSRGLRLRVGDRAAGDVRVEAQAHGLVTQGDSFTEGSVSQAITLSFSTAVVVDTEPPTVSDLAFDSFQQIFTGEASDNMSITGVTLWDGPVLLATTDLDDVDLLGLPAIVFPGGGTAFRTYINLPAGNHVLTVVATDFTGNDTSLNLPVTAY